MKPVIVINFKTYPEATGAKAEALAKICDDVARECKADIRVAVQAADIYRVAKSVKIPVYAEHVDPITPGRNTGYILPEAVKAEGAIGTLLNHSEHRLDEKTLEASVDAAKKAGLKVIICAPTPEAGAHAALLKPEFVAVEPPELIAGKVSVSEAEPEVITKSVKLVKAPLLVGAGIHERKDVEIAVKLGAKGVLLASDITTAKDPEKELRELCG